VEGGCESHETFSVERKLYNFGNLWSKLKTGRHFFEYATPACYYIYMFILFIYLFIYLFNNAFSSSDYITSDHRKINELRVGTMWKEMVVAKFSVLSLHLRGGTEGIMINLRRNRASG
jgi:hypothetical protein